MTRRFRHNMLGERFLADASVAVVHDLDNEKPQCRIEDILDGEQDRPYTSLRAAESDGHEICPFCVSAPPAAP